MAFTLLSRIDFKVICPNFSIVVIAANLFRGFSARPMPDICLLSDEFQCYKEQYSTENYISTNNSNVNLDYNSLSIINKNIYQGIINNKLTK